MSPIVDKEFPITALVILASADNSQIEAQLLDLLSEFTISVLDSQRIQLRGRLIVGIHIGIDPAHVMALDEDLAAFASKHQVDVGIDFSEVA